MDTNSEHKKKMWKEEQEVLVGREAREAREARGGVGVRRNFELSHICLLLYTWSELFTF